MLFIPFAFSDFLAVYSNTLKTREGISVAEFPHYQVSWLVLDTQHNG
jgi:hypothetical protein